VLMRPLLVEASLLTRHFEQLQKRSTFETGLVLALHGHKSDTVLRFVRTPDADEDAATTIDPPWVVEHAKQLRRMLPGGLFVVGMYVLASSAKLSALEPKVLSVLSSLAKRLPESGEAQVVVLELPTDAKKPLCRTLASTANKLSPLELKTVNGAEQIHCFSAAWEIDLNLRLSTSAEGPPRLTTSQLLSHVADTTASIRSAVATVDGDLPAAGALVGDLSRVGTCDEPHTVHLYSLKPPLGTSAVEGELAVVGSGRLSGTLYGRAFAAAKEEVSWALDHLLADLVGSLEARLALLVDDLADEENETDGLPLDAPNAWPMARRAHFQVERGISLCDYIASGETAADSLERLHELLGVQLPDEEDEEKLEELLGPERPASVEAARASEPVERQAAARDGASVGTDKGTDKDPPRTSGSFSLWLGALVVVIAAVIMALGFHSAASTALPESVASTLQEVPAHEDGALPSSGE